MEHVNLFLELMRQKNGTIGVKEFLDFNIRGCLTIEGFKNFQQNLQVDASR